MKKILIVTFAMALISLLVCSPVWARSCQFQMLTEADVDGTHLSPGKYKLILEGEDAEIYRNGHLLVRAKVEVHGLGKGVSAHSIKIVNGQLREIRLKKDCLVFTD
jgi:hypothetical protein